MEARALVFDVFGTVVDWRGGVTREAGTSSSTTASANHTIRKAASCTRWKKFRSLEPVKAKVASKAGVTASSTARLTRVLLV